MISLCSLESSDLCSFSSIECLWNFYVFLLGSIMRIAIVLKKGEQKWLDPIVGYVGSLTQRLDAVMMKQEEKLLRY